MNKQKIKHKLRCIAIDDEPFALEIMADDIQKMPFLELIGTFSNPLDSIPVIEEEMVDLIFLDIQMPTLTGTQFLRNLPSPPMVIFTTAYAQYALEGYDLNIVDYLLKPIPYERFLQAINKALDLHKLRLKKETESTLDGRTYFFIHAEYKQIKIFHDEILYIEGLKDYVKIYLHGQLRPVLTRLNLKNIETKLSLKHFCRVHQSYIVALDRIVSFQKTKLLIDNVEIPIGRRFSDKFEQIYSQN